MEKEWRRTAALDGPPFSKTRRGHCTSSSSSRMSVRVLKVNMTSKFCQRGLPSLQLKPRMPPHSIAPAQVALSCLPCTAKTVQSLCGHTRCKVGIYTCMVLAGISNVVAGAVGAGMTGR